MFLSLIILFIFPVTANASLMENDGLEVTIDTDRENYEEGEAITATITVTNTKDEPVQILNLEQLVPEGYVIEEGSDFEGEVTLGKGEFRKYCANGCGEEEFGEIDALGHDWGRWTVVRPATVYTTGLMQRVCERCGEVETRVIPKLEKPSIPDDDEEEDREDEDNPDTGAPYMGSALAAIATLAGVAVIIEKARKH